LKETICNNMKSKDDPFQNIIFIFYEKIKAHRDLSRLFEDIHENKVEAMMKAVCAIASGRAIQMSPQDIEKKHRPLYIGNRLYTTFKLLLIDSMKQMEMNNHFIQQTNDNLELYRRKICFQKPFFLKLGGEDFIKSFARDLMLKLSVDPSFSKFFQNINIYKHGEFLSRFFIFLLGENENLSQFNLGKIHNHLGITETHVTFFKFTIEKILRKMGVREKYIEQFLSVLEPLRNNLLGRPQPWEIILKYYGYMGSFSKEFISKTSQIKSIQQSFKSHCRSPLKKSMSNEEYNNFFENHQIKVVEYILNKHVTYFKPKNLRNIHKHCVITSDAFEVN
jgi:truncated hemoglobin YjbI